MHRVLRGSSTALLMTVLAACGSDDEATGSPVVDAGGDLSDAPAEAAPDAIEPADAADAATDAAEPDSQESDAQQESDAPDPNAITIPGQSAAVTVRVDEKGMKHILCQTDEDCMAAYGYVVARDNFMLIDLIRRSARGRFAEIGSDPSYLEHDVAQRHFLSTRQGVPLEEAIWAELRPDTKALIEAQTRGINAWLDDLKAGRHDAALAPEIVAAWPSVVDDLMPWEALDSVAITASGEQGETGDGIAPDVSNAQYLSILGPDYFRDLLLGLPVADATIANGQVPLSANPAPHPLSNQLLSLEHTRNRLAAYASVVDEVAERQASIRALHEMVAQPHASNNWAVGGSRTGHGNAIVENDPDGPLGLPTHMYAVEVDAVSQGSGTLHFFGTGLADAAIYIGRNENIAWGLTTSMADLIDFYEETLVDDDAAVLFNGQQVPIEYHDITVRRADGSTTVVSRPWVPHHGPLLAVDEQNDIGISARWVGHEPNADLDAWIDLLRATSAQEALAIARRFEARGNNLVVGDDEGHITWRPLIKVPDRPWADQYPPYLPLPGDGSAEWGGYLAVEDVPELYGPPDGFVATANNDFTGAWYDGDPTNDGTPYMQFACDSGARAVRIREVLSSSQDHDSQAMLALQMDSYVWIASRIMPTLLTFMEQSGAVLSPAGQSVYDALVAWQFTCPTGLDGILRDSPNDPDAAAASESIGCSAYHAFMMALSDRVWLDDCQSLGLTCSSGSFFDSLIYATLERPGDLALGTGMWDDLSTLDVETQPDIVAAAMEDAANTLVDLRGSDVDEWRWGRVLYMQVQPVIDIGTTYPKQGPYAVSGGMFTVNPVVGERSQDGLEHAYGAMLRMVVDFGAPGTSDLWQIPGGPGHHPSSPYFLSMIEDYAAGVPFAVPVGPAEVEAAAVETFLVLPADD